jgi:hypothetical protein
MRFWLFALAITLSAFALVALSMSAAVAAIAPAVAAAIAPAAAETARTTRKTELGRNA